MAITAITAIRVIRDSTAFKVTIAINIKANNIIKVFKAIKTFKAILAITAS